MLEFDEDEPLAIEVAASTSAEDFVHLVNLAYRPKSVAKEDHVFDKAQADIAIRLLRKMRYATGLNGEEPDTATLAAWIGDVGSLATASDRYEVAMVLVGDVLGRVRGGTASHIRTGQSLQRWRSPPATRCFAGLEPRFSTSAA